MSLSYKIIDISKIIYANNHANSIGLGITGIKGKLIFVDDVKEFIKELKEKIDNGHNYETIENGIFFKKEIIDKLAGEKLI